MKDDAAVAQALKRAEEHEARLAAAEADEARRKDEFEREERALQRETQHPRVFRCSGNQRLSAL